MAEVIKTAVEPIAKPTKSPSGSGGTVNGAAGLPKRTSSPNAVDEVTLDGAGGGAGKRGRVPNGG